MDNLSPPAMAVLQAGLVKATVGNVTGAANVRVFPPLPWTENFRRDGAPTPFRRSGSTRL